MSLWSRSPARPVGSASAATGGGSPKSRHIGSRRYHPRRPGAPVGAVAAVLAALPRQNRPQGLQQNRPRSRPWRPAPSRTSTASTLASRKAPTMGAARQSVGYYVGATAWVSATIYIRSLPTASAMRSQAAISRASSAFNRAGVSRSCRGEGFAVCSRRAPRPRVRAARVCRAMGTAAVRSTRSLDTRGPRRRQRGG